MKLIKLSGKLGEGKFAKVDDDFYEQYGGWSWNMGHGYATHGGSSRGTVRMHRLVVNAPKGKVVDHLNGDKLDNRRSNLRICTIKENNNNKKGVKGYFLNSDGRYYATYKGKHCGSYETAEEARRAHELAKSGVVFEPRKKRGYKLPPNIFLRKGGYEVTVMRNRVRLHRFTSHGLEDAKRILDDMKRELEEPRLRTLTTLEGDSKS